MAIVAEEHDVCRFKHKLACNRCFGNRENVVPVSCGEVASLAKLAALMADAS